MLKSKQSILEASIDKCDPNIRGVYFLINNSDEIVYVGTAQNICNRVKSHKANPNMIGKFSCWSYVECEDAVRLHFEKSYIKRFKPFYNLQHNPNAIEESLIAYELMTESERSVVNDSVLSIGSKKKRIDRIKVEEVLNRHNIKLKCSKYLAKAGNSSI